MEESDLKLIRQRLNLTQAQFASVFGIRGQTYNLYENGKKKVPVHIVKKLKEKYNIDYVQSNFDQEEEKHNYASPELMERIIETMSKAIALIQKDHEIYQALVEQGVKDGALKFIVPTTKKVSM